MTQSKNITLSSTVSTFNQQTRYLKPSGKNCRWCSTTLPYNLNPGDRVKISSSESRLSGEFYLIQDQYLTEIGLILVRVDDNTNSYTFIAFNMGNSTITLNPSDPLGKCIHINGSC